jgi:hypothetical protein
MVTMNSDGLKSSREEKRKERVKKEEGEHRILIEPAV